MAKQTFTTGQVLTAAQMTSLQQTAMLGGAASAKTASYTLVAADAGTAISMSNASATTITVNTALFAAGDTVQITNLGAGVCTITAGTATVNSSASLALAQYESGTLVFTSTSAAIFIKGAGAAASASWQTYTPTWTNLTKGNGTETSRYIDQNGLITWWYSLVFGSTSSMGTTPIITLPVAAKTGTNRVPVPNISMLDSGVQVVYGFMDFKDDGTDRGVFYSWNTGVNPLGGAGITSSAPFTWSTGDAIRFQVSYEKA